MYCANAFIASKRRFTCKATILDICPGVRYLASVPAACRHREAPERDVTRSVTEDLDLRRVLWQFDCVQYVADNWELTKYTSARFITQRSHTINHEHVGTLSTVFSSHTNLAMATYVLCALQTNVYFPRCTVNTEALEIFWIEGESFSCLEMPYYYSTCIFSDETSPALSGLRLRAPSSSAPLFNTFNSIPVTPLTRTSAVGRQFDNLSGRPRPSPMTHVLSLNRENLPFCEVLSTSSRGTCHRLKITTYVDAMLQFPGSGLPTRGVKLPNQRHSSRHWNRKRSSSF
jgi:hypothetical protein